MASPPAPAKSSTLFIEKPPDSRCETLRVLQLAFPDGQHLPALPRERSLVPLVSLAITFQFRGPEVDAGFGHARQNAIGVAMPEASMYEDNLAPRPEYEVGTARKSPRVQSVAIAEREDNLADSQLRARVLRAHSRHDFRPFLWRERVHHKVLRPLPGHKQWPLVRNILLAGFAHDPVERHFFLRRDFFQSLVEIS